MRLSRFAPFGIVIVEQFQEPYQSFPTEPIPSNGDRWNCQLHYPICATDQLAPSRAGTVSNQGEYIDYRSSSRRNFEYRTHRHTRPISPNEVEMSCAAWMESATSVVNWKYQAGWILLHPHLHVPRQPFHDHPGSAGKSYCALRNATVVVLRMEVLR